MKLFNFIPFIRKANTIAQIYSNSTEFTIADSYDTERRLAKFASEVIVNELESRGYKVYPDDSLLNTSLFYLEYPISCNFSELGRMGADELFELTASLISDSLDCMNIPAETKKVYIYRANIDIAETLNFKLRVEIKYAFK